MRDHGALGNELPGGLGLCGQREDPAFVVFAAAGAEGVLAAAVVAVLEGVDVEGVVALVEEAV